MRSWAEQVKYEKAIVDKLLDYIDVRIDEKIEDAFGRDALHEARATYQVKQELMDLIKP